MTIPQPQYLRRLTTKIAAYNSLLLGGAVVVVVLVGTVWEVRKTQAEFEVPNSNTENFTSADLYGSYGYFRVDRYNTSPDPNTTSSDSTGVHRYFESWAVGKNLDNNPSEPEGVIYRFDGTQWTRIIPTILGGATADTEILNAVAGQYNPGQGKSELWFVGDRGKIFYNTNGNTDPAYTTDYFVNTFVPGEVTAASQIICGGTNAPITNKLYAVGAAAAYGATALAGGQGGLLLIHKKSGNHFPLTPDTWDRVCSPLASNEHVTSITFGQDNRGFITTSLQGADFDRAAPCASGKLYRFDRVQADVNGNSLYNADLTLLATINGQCIFSSTARTLNAGSGFNGPLNTSLWLGTSNGIYTVTDTGGFTSADPVNGTSGKIFSVASSRLKAGTANSLLLNGNFEAWESASPNSLTRTASWTYSDASIGRNNTAGGCSRNINNYKNVTGAEAYSGRSVKIDNTFTTYSNSTCAIATKTNDYTDSIFQRVDLSNLEGSRFRISGQYRVNFPEVEAGALAPKFAQGGIAITCPGGDGGSQPDCTFNNRDNILNKVHSPTGTGNGYTSFSLDISNQQEAFTPPVLGSTGQPRIADAGMVIEISCQATYGARVWCDDIKIEAIDSPGLSSLDRVTVAGVGQNGQVWVNNNAAGSGTFVSEKNLAGTENLYSINAAGSPYFFAVGANNTVATRPPTNLAGYIWAGQASPATSGRAGLGWISSGCNNSQTCLQTPASYGLVLNLEPSRLALSGSAWFGKNYTSTGANNDNETISLGSCQNPARLASLPANQPYAITGSCNPATRRCTANAAKSCIRDFDCYGHCQKDAGFICLYDADCEVGATNAALNTPNPSLNGSRLQTAPGYRLQCDQNNSSALACGGGGWLALDQVDFQGTPPNGSNPNNDCGAAGGVCFTPGSTTTLQGWGQFMTLANGNDPNGASGTGWVSFRGATSPAQPTVIAGSPQLVSCQNCTGPKGAMTCSSCQDTNGQSCTISSNTCSYFCDGDPDGPNGNDPTSCATDADCTTVSPTSTCKAVGRCSGDASVSCSSDAVCAAGNKGYCSRGALCSITNPANVTCQRYGVNYHPNEQAFSGYAWSPDYGWLDFHYLTYGASRYIQTQLGDIYSQRQIGDFTTRSAPGAKCNATYVIAAGDTINNFCSNFSPAVLNYEIQQNADPVPFVSQQNAYQNSLGRIDVVGMETITDVGQSKNKYGNYVANIDSLIPDPGPGNYKNLSLALGNHMGSDLAIANSGFLGGSVSIAGSPGGTSTYRVDQPLGFADTAKVNLSSPTSLVNAAGVIIINGNLRIDKNMRYVSSGSSITDLRELASLTIIIRGNLIIDTGVTDIVGAYYVTGSICTAPRGSLAVPPTDATLCLDGVIAGGHTANTFPLTVRGLMIARQFVFGRTFAGTSGQPLPSELFIHDGRLQSNPMPGMTDFTNALPSTVTSSP